MEAHKLLPLNFSPSVRQVCVLLNVAKNLHKIELLASLLLLRYAFNESNDISIPLSFCRRVPSLVFATVLQRNNTLRSPFTLESGGTEVSCSHIALARDMKNTICDPYWSAWSLQGQFESRFFLCEIFYMSKNDTSTLLPIRG